MENKQREKQAKRLSAAQRQLKAEKAEVKGIRLTPDARLSAQDKRRLTASIGKAKRDGRIPRTAQQTIPYREMCRDGICAVTDHYFTKQIQFFDINYQLAQNEDKNLIFENYCDFLNYFDSSIRVQLSFLNQWADMEERAQSIHIAEQADRFNGIRVEYSDMPVSYTHLDVYKRQTVYPSVCPMDVCWTTRNRLLLPSSSSRISLLWRICLSL